MDPLRRPWLRRQDFVFGLGSHRSRLWACRRRADLSPGSSTPTCARCRSGLERLRPATCRALDPRGLPRASSRRPPTRNPDRAVDPRWWLGDVRPSRVGRRPGRPRLRDRRSCSACLPNRDHHGAWVQQPGARARRDPTATPRPGRRTVRGADADRPADRHPARGRHARRRATGPRTTADEYYARSSRAQRYLHSYGVTGWQDAIVGAYSGMDDPARRTCEPRRATLRPRRGGAVVGPPPRRGADRRPRRAS